MNRDSRVNTYDNIYKIARELSGMTQEQAAEKIGISLRTISNAETFQTIPKEEHVDSMVRIYNAPWLAYMHFKRSTFLGRKYLPDISLDDLARSVLKFQKEMKDVKEITPTMIEIACDGVIDEHEKERWSKVRCEIFEFIGAAMAIYYANENFLPFNF